MANPMGGGDVWGSRPPLKKNFAKCIVMKQNDINNTKLTCIMIEKIILCRLSTSILSIELTLTVTQIVHNWKEMNELTVTVTQKI